MPLNHRKVPKYCISGLRFTIVFFIVTARFRPTFEKKITSYLILLRWIQARPVIVYWLPLRQLYELVDAMVEFGNGFVLSLDDIAKVSIGSSQDFRICCYIVAAYCIVVTCNLIGDILSFPIE